VIIPRRNVQDLMLRREVVEAVAAGKFHVYPVSAIDEGMEILTGIEAGAPREDGTFEEGTVNALVDAELRRLASGWKKFQAETEKGS
jgi:ATP-dependent Lon protease